MYTEGFIRSTPDKVDWYKKSYSQKLSENFIRKYQNKLDWDEISKYQHLNEKFIREFKDKINWGEISRNQRLSEGFIKEFKYMIDWEDISINQKLSESFIEEFQDRIKWNHITRFQKLSEEFIREFKDKFNWNYISYFQILSKEFIEEFKDIININIQILTHHNKLTLQEKQELVEKYCEKYNLESVDDYLYAFRDHNMNNSGMFNKTIKYEKNEYYYDWRCNLNPEDLNSFGFGIFPEGNTKVKIKIEDIGCLVNDNDKLRVWGFEII